MFNRIGPKTIILGIVFAIVLAKSRSRLSSPLKDARMTSAFGRRGGGVHKGADLVSTDGKIMAAANGRIIFAGVRADGLGNTVIVDHQDGRVTLYGHLRSFSSQVCLGGMVSKGGSLGVMGNTGRSTGTHLHFMVYEKSPDGTWIARNPSDLVDSLVTGKENSSLIGLLASDSAPTRLDITGLISKAEKVSNCSQPVIQTAKKVRGKVRKASRKRSSAKKTSPRSSKGNVVKKSKSARARGAIQGQKKKKV